MIYDHFHLTYKHQGEVAEIEGGLSPKLNDEDLQALRAKTWAENLPWMIECGRSFGLPDGAEIRDFRVAG